MADLIKIKKIKGKQNKKKWAKNIDVSELMDSIQKKNIQKARQQQQPELIIQQTNEARKPLDPQRFKNRTWKTPKPHYNNKFQKEDFITKDLADPWAMPVQSQSKIKPSDVSRIPSIVKPMSGHSYNAKKQYLDQIKQQIVRTQGRKPEKKKKIKKFVQKVMIPRARNKNVRAQQLEIKARRQQNLRKHQLNSYQKISRQIDEKNKIMAQRQKVKQQKKNQEQQQKKTGKITKGPKLNKKRYEYRQYLPNEQQLGKAVSKISYSQDLMRQRYDNIFRKGIMQVRNIKIHANKKKGIKVKQNFRQ